MAWVKLDDQAPRNLKMLRAGPAACWLWVCGIAHSQSQLTDGFISFEVLPMIGVQGTALAKKLAEVLVSAGLFERADGGYRVHDYHMFNATAEEVRAGRADLSLKRSEAGRMGGLASGVSRKQTAKQVAEANRSPIPSHPIPSEKNESEPARVLDAFRARWKAAYGFDCSVLESPLEIMKLEQQLAAHGVAQLLAAVDAYFATPEPYVQRAKHPLPLFLRDPLKYLAKDPVVRGRPRNCKHDPACVDDAAHTARDMAERRTVAS